MRGKAREARRRRLLGHMQKLEKVMAQPQAVPGAAGAGAAPGEEGAGGVVGATGSVHLEGGGRVRGEEINIIITGMREEARARERANERESVREKERERETSCTRRRVDMC